jgi:hypothetical protein
MILTRINRITMTGMNDNTAKNPFNTPSTKKSLTHCAAGEPFAYKL